MSITRVALDNSRLVIAATLLIILGGVLTFLSFPAQEDPPIKVREAIVSAYFPGMSPERVENLITKPLEQKIREIPQVQRVTSSVYTGGTTISVKLYDRYFDLTTYWQTLRNKMADVASSLPKGTSGPFINDDFGQVAVATVAITAGGFTMAEMREPVRKFRERLKRVRGVKRIGVHGLQNERVYLEADPGELSRFGLSIGTIIAALQSQNVILSGGQIIADGMIVTVAPSGNYERLSDIGSTPIKLPKSGQTVKLRDLMTLRRGYEEPRTSAAYYNNKPAVVLAVSMIEGDNVVEFGKRLKKAVAALNPTLPLGFETGFATFQPDIVAHSVKEVERTLYETLIIVLVVVMLFLGLRTGLVVGSIVPLTMLMSLIVMRMMEIELQRVSIASMIIALGLLVDNGIVIAEDVMRRLAGGEKKRDACVNAGANLALPLLTSSLTVILAFTPLLLADDSTGEYVRSLAQVIAISLISSWLLALTVTPLMCYYFLSDKGHDGESDEQFETRFYRIYKAVLGGVMRQRVVFLLLIVGLFAAAIHGFGKVPQQFFPNSSRNSFMVMLNLPAGTSIDETGKSLHRVNAWLLDKAVNPEVTSIVSYLGYGGPRIVLATAPVPSGPQRAFILVNVPQKTVLTPVVDRVRLHLLKNFPELAGEAKEFWLGGTEPGLVQFRIVGEDANTLKGLSEKIKEMLIAVPGTIDVKDDWENRVFKMTVNINQERTRRAGLSSAAVAQSLATALRGMQISFFRKGDQSIPIVLRGREEVKLTLDRLRTLYVFSDDGKKSVPLMQLADFTGVPEDGVIKRRNEQRTMTVSAKNLTLSASQLTRRVRAQVRGLELPPGYNIGVGGELEVSGNAQGALFKFMPLCFGAIMLLMVWQFNSFRSVAIIAITIPLCLIGAVAGLLVSQATFGFMAIMGLMSLAGIIVNNAILLIERINEERDAGMEPYDAVMSAAVKRLRPIVMTKLTCICGLIPLMLYGGELWYGMTVVIMGGLALGTLLTLGVIPVLYTLLFRVQIPERKKKQPPSDDVVPEIGLANA